MRAGDDYILPTPTILDLESPSSLHLGKEENIRGFNVAVSAQRLYFVHLQVYCFHFSYDPSRLGSGRFRLPSNNFSKTLCLI